MHKWVKILRDILILYIVFRIIFSFSPNTSITISKISNLSNEQISNVLTIFDIGISLIIALYSLVEQKLAERRCLYEFAIEKDNLSFNTYRRFSSELSTAFSYDYSRQSEDIQKPYYGIEIELENQAIKNVGIPLRMEVSTNLFGKSIVLSNLRIVAAKNGKLIVKKNSFFKNLEINMPIKDKKKFLVRLLLSCNADLEKELLDSRIYLNFTLTFYDDRGRSYKKYFLLTIQNSFGEPRILSVTSTHNWISYIGYLIKYNCHLK